MNQQHATAHAHGIPPHARRAHRTRHLNGLGRRVTRAVRIVFDRYLLLPIGAVIAIVWVNLAPESYFTTTWRFSFLVNEVGMAFFFALLAQEVTEAIMPGGALHSWRKWTLPIAAALGGIIGAVGVYWAFAYLRYETLLTEAWPITFAIDIAATYYVMKTIMPRGGALPFALVVAIVTDMVGMIAVAPTYVNTQERLGGASLMVMAIGFAALMRAVKERRFWPYLLICGPLSWAAFYWEGLHPAFSLIPIVPLLPHEPRRINLVADPPDDDAVHHAEHEWHLLVQIVVFLFGLVNAGVLLRDYDTGTWGMLLANLVGRPFGIVAAVGIAMAAGLHLPRHVGWREIVVIAFAASSGFAVALFFATGVLAPGPLLAQVKVGVLASAVGALLALAIARALKVGKFAR